MTQRLVLGVFQSPHRRRTMVILDWHVSSISTVYTLQRLKAAHIAPKNNSRGLVYVGGQSLQWPNFDRCFHQGMQTYLHFFNSKSTLHI